MNSSTVNTLTEENTRTPANDDCHYLDAVYYFIGIIGIIGNAFVILIMLTSRTLRRRSANQIITNQSVIDGSACVFLIAIAVDDSERKNEVICDVWFTKMPLWALLVTSTYNLILLTLDRYLAIVWPLQHRFNCTSRMFPRLLFLPWLFGVGFNCAYFIPTTVFVGGNGTDDPGHCDKFTKWPSAEFQFGFGVVIVLVQYMVPISLQIIFYSLIVYSIRRRSRDSTLSLAETRSKSGTRVCYRKGFVWSRAQRNSVKTAFIVSLCFILCWTVDQSFFVKYFLSGAEDYDDNFFEYTLVVVTTNCSVNPVIYCLQYESFQREVKNRICRRNSSKAGKTKTFGQTFLKQTVMNIFAISNGQCSGASTERA